METGRELNFSTAATSIPVPLLHPFYTYECVISAYTVAIGPYTEIVVMTQEDGRLSLRWMLPLVTVLHGYTSFVLHEST